ncbi:amidohydrolase family protein [Ruegeria sp. Ofav3-42]|uniref:metal-dependent hydrolase family protein n=1 Tax=Ruegeria sp. Ofav3-42 TaxID=2917759 RepID=UPI001EF73159|nr:amidohydrolase family protein [Ruegeria sp. Ofav3-42]MCG7522789.1 amidohydrolase family protein [Ruegeria sp. Ofav3-42]
MGMVSARAILSAALTVFLAFGAFAQEDLPQTLFVNVDVFDSENAVVIENANVLVEGNLIVEVSTDPIEPNGAVVIDGQGRTLIPGLIDGHNHIMLPTSPLNVTYNLHWSYTGALVTREAERMLMRGFTTLRDAGGPSYGIAQAIDDGIVPGPRIFSSGHWIGQTSGHFDFRLYNDTHHRQRADRTAFEREWAFIADGVSEVRAATREVLRLGATQIKISLGGGTSTPYDPLDTTHYSPEEIRAAVEAAEDWNTYVIVHAYTDESVIRSLAGGVKSIDHGNMIFEEETIRAIRDAGAILNPQFLIFTPDEEMLAIGDPASIEKGAPLRDNVEHYVALIKKYDLPIAFGVDLFGAPELMAMQNLEFERRGRWWSGAEVLQQATYNTAKLVEMSGPRNPYQQGPLGVIKAGAYADLVLVDGDPVEDINLLVDPEANFLIIMKDGVVYKNTLGN